MFSGSIVALVTPMTEAGDIDYTATERLLSMHIDNKTDAMVILGTTGESSSLTVEERQTFITFIIEKAEGKLPILVGTGSNSTSHTITLTQQAADLKADGVLIVTPYYNKPSREGLYQHFSTIAQAVDIPQIIYNVPSRTGCDILPETVKRLDAYPAIVGLKDATGNLDRLQDMQDRGVTMDLFSGDDGTSCDFILKGGRGVISVAANIAPEFMVALCRLALDQQSSEALRLNDQMKPIYESLSVESNPIPVKWALHQLGLIDKGIRLPLTPLVEPYRNGLYQSLQKIGLI